MPKFLIDKISLELVEGTTQEEFLEKTYALDGDNITGVLPISKGGTGATTWLNAINNLQAIRQFDFVWNNPNPTTYVSPMRINTGMPVNNFDYFLVECAVCATGGAVQAGTFTVPVVRGQGDNYYSDVDAHLSVQLTTTINGVVNFVLITRPITFSFPSGGDIQINVLRGETCLLPHGGNPNINYEDLQDFFIVPKTIYGTKAGV